MATEIERISRMFEKTFDKQPWYGSSIIETISNIDSVMAEKRHGQAHSIIDLIRHMTSWRTFAAKRLEGDNVFEVDDSLNFPTTGTWEEALKNLKDSQRHLLEAIKFFPETRLGDLVPGKTMKYTFYTLLHGIIQHDIYHLGQIAYIKKSLT